MNKVSSETRLAEVHQPVQDRQQSGDEAWQRWSLAWEQTAGRTWFKPALDASGLTSSAPATSARRSAAAAISVLLVGRPPEPATMTIGVESRRVVSGGTPTMGDVSETHFRDEKAAGRLRDECPEPGLGASPSAEAAAQNEQPMSGSEAELEDRPTDSGAQTAPPHPDHAQLGRVSAEDVMPQAGSDSPSVPAGAPCLEARMAASRSVLAGLPSADGLRGPDAQVAPGNTQPPRSLQPMSISALARAQAAHGLPISDATSVEVSKSQVPDHALLTRVRGSDPPVRLTLTPDPLSAGLTVWVGVDRGMEALAHRQIELLHQHLAGLGHALTTVHLNGQAWAGWRAELSARDRTSRLSSGLARPAAQQEAAAMQEVPAGEMPPDARGPYPFNPRRPS